MEAISLTETVKLIGKGTVCLNDRGVSYGKGVRCLYAFHLIRHTSIMKTCIICCVVIET